MKIFIFNGTLSFQIIILYLSQLSQISAPYMDVTENTRFDAAPYILIIYVVQPYVCHLNDKVMPKV
jgi:hypothetical protein